MSHIAQSWYDPRLAWMPGDYGGMEKVHAKASDVWIPPLVLNNA